MHPLLKRLTRLAEPSLAWVAALVFAWLLFATLPDEVRGLVPGANLRLSGVARAELAVAAAVPVLFARRWPPPVLGLLLAEVLASAVAGLSSPAWLPASAFLLFAVAVTRPRRVSFTAFTLALGAWAAADAFQPPGARSIVANPLTHGGLSVVPLALAVALVSGVLIRERREHAVAMRGQAAAHAVTAERLRIARELHDMVAHSIGIIAIQSGAARRVMDTQPDKARDALGAIETASQETLAGLRHMLGALRQAGTSDAADRAPVTGLADVERLAAKAAEAGVEVEVRWSGRLRPLPPEIEVSAFRIIQEAVTNVVRHAGTHRCSVAVEFRQEELAVEVTDDGRGGAAEGAGYGLVGMRERVSLLRGDFTAGPRPEGGFRVAARIPA
ncbi:MAG: sensor histidine kinase [Trebonia sp.]